MRRPLYIIWYSAALAALLVLAASCGPGKGKARVEGKFAHVQRAEVYLLCPDGSREGIDTLRIERGKFKADIDCNEPTLFTLLFQNFTEYSLIAAPGATVTIDADAQKLSAMSVTGTDDNALLTDFRQQTAGRSEADVRRAASDFIRSHPESLAAVAVLRDVFARPQQPPAEAKALLDILLRAQPQCRALRFVEQGLRPKLAAAKGAALPDFTATTLDGASVSASDYSGHPALIVFTATWTQRHNELQRVLPDVRRAAPAGTKFLLVSLDTDQQRLRDRMERDTLGLPVVCDGKAFASPLVATLGVTQVPGNLLVASDGRIIARDIEPAKLADEVRKLK